ncbi:hypothetical protein ACH3XW_39350 [Acanthocheilonema viteae]
MTSRVQAALAATSSRKALSSVHTRRHSPLTANVSAQSEQKEQSFSVRQGTSGTTCDTDVSHIDRLHVQKI